MARARSDHVVMWSDHGPGHATSYLSKLSEAILSAIADNDMSSNVVKADTLAFAEQIWNLYFYAKERKNERQLKEQKKEWKNEWTNEIKKERKKKD